MIDDNIRIDDICVCVSGYKPIFDGKKKPLEDHEYGGVGYVDGAMFRMTRMTTTHPNSHDAFFASELNGGVFRKVCRLATPEEIAAFETGVRNVYDISRKYLIGYRNKLGEDKKFEVYAVSDVDAVSRLNTSLSNHLDELTAINYIMK